MKITKSNLLITILLVIIALSLLIAGCEPTLSCTTTNSSMKCNYKDLSETKDAFKERKELNVKNGQVLELSYNSIVNSGDITFDVEFKQYKTNIATSMFNVRFSKNKTLWNLKLNSSDSNKVSIPIKEDGAILIHIIGNKANGSYEINWNVK